MNVLVAVISTNRSSSLGRLLDQLCAAALRHDVRLRFVVVENSTVAGERDAVRRHLRCANESGHPTLVEWERSGDPIGPARERARSLVARDAAANGSPDVIWFLDDDVELVHEHVAGGVRRVEPLYDVFGAVVAEALNPQFEVLIGTVTGDPPIPPIATYASRLADLVANLERQDGRDEDETWEVDPRTLAQLDRMDAYYDFSTGRSTPTWQDRVLWLPTRETETVASAREALLTAVADVPLGGSFTRPILTKPGREAERWPGTNRGGNCLFFSVDACLSHRYPTLFVDGVTTRRSDMIGSSLLTKRYPALASTGGLSVWHRRSRTDLWPTRRQLIQSLLGDTWGATIARWVRSSLEPEAVAGWFRDRVAAIEAAAREWWRSLRLLRGSRPFRRGDPRLHRLVSWASEALPLAPCGTLHDDVRDRLASREIHQQLRSFAAGLLAEDSCQGDLLSRSSATPPLATPREPEPAKLSARP